MSPGSDAARLLGCICDPAVNNAGCGDWWSPTINGGTRFVIDSACMLHGTSVWASNMRIGSTFTSAEARRQTSKDSPDER